MGILPDCHWERNDGFFLKLCEEGLLGTSFSLVMDLLDLGLEELGADFGVDLVRRGLFVSLKLDFF